MIPLKYEKMRVRRIYYTNLGLYFFGLFKSDINSFPKIIEGIINIDPEQKIDIPGLYEELTYLYCFAYFQVIRSKFRTNFRTIEKSFLGELSQFLKKSQSKPSAARIESSLSRTLKSYQQQYRQTIGHYPGREGQVKFASFIVERMLGTEQSRKVSTIMYFLSIYGGIVSSLMKVIDTSIQIIK